MEQTMNRRELLRSAAAFGVVGGAGILPVRATSRAPHIAGDIVLGDVRARPDPLQPPARGTIPVAFPVSNGAVGIDVCGPWDVFECARLGGRREALFRLYTVAETLGAVTASGGMRIDPNFTFETAPLPKVIVIPGQGEPSAAMLGWIQRTSPGTDLTMSVCTGAFVLAKAGLLRGKPATTHHNSYTDLAMQFPDIRVKRGLRFVETGNLATAGGQYSGVDLALRVVERYFGRTVAAETADFMEYQGSGWRDMNSNQTYRQHQASTAAHPLCPVCEMNVDPGSALTSQYGKQTYYFCMSSHKAAFDKAPEAYLEAL